MRQFNKLRGTRGFLHVANRGIRFRYMITTEAKRRAHILTFWKKYGYDATYEAYTVKERTLFDWQRKLKKHHGKLESLNNGSRAPKQVRRRRWDYRIVEEITRLRDTYPNLGEKKLYPLLAEYCASHTLICPKPATIGNIIKDKGGLRTVPQRITGTGRIVRAHRVKILRKPKDVRIENPGALVALDTIVVIIHGKRYYIVTVEDIYSRFAFAWATTSHASKAAEEFFRMWQAAFPYATTFVLTDNGSEFKKHFAARLLELQITHYHTYPRTPKMNAHVERFNRTIQEEFVDFHKNLLLNLDTFNAKLIDWLLFYNTKRVHHAFKNKLSPVQYLLQYEANLPADCRSTLGYTLY